jgi:hypothetical protein
MVGYDVGVGGFDVAGHEGSRDEETVKLEWFLIALDRLKKPAGGVARRLVRGSGQQLKTRGRPALVQTNNAKVGF